MRNQGGGEDRYGEPQPGSEPPSQPYPPAEREGQYGWPSDPEWDAHHRDQQTSWQGGRPYGPPPPHAQPGPAYGPPPQAQPGAAYGPPPPPASVCGSQGWYDQQRGYQPGPARGGYGAYGQYTDGAYGYGPPLWHGYAPPAPHEQSAVWALILSIASYPLMFACGAGIITLVVSFVLAPHAQQKIEASGGALQGAGVAQAAMVLNWILLGLVIFAIVIVAIGLVGTASFSVASGRG